MTKKNHCRNNKCFHLFHQIIQLQSTWIICSLHLGDQKARKNAIYVVILLNLNMLRKQILLHVGCQARVYKKGTLNMMCSSRTCNWWKLNLYLCEAEERYKETLTWTFWGYIYFFFMLVGRDVVLRKKEIITLKTLYSLGILCSNTSNFPRVFWLWEQALAQRYSPPVTCRYMFKGGNYLFAETLWEYCEQYMPNRPLTCTSQKHFVHRISPSPPTTGVWTMQSFTSFILN